MDRFKISPKVLYVSVAVLVLLLIKFAVLDNIRNMTPKANINHSNHIPERHPSPKTHIEKTSQFITSLFVSNRNMSNSNVSTKSSLISTQHLQVIPDYNKNGLLDLENPENILIAYRNGNMPNAITLLEQLVWNSNWENLSAVDCLYEIYMEQEMLNQAEILLRQATAINSDKSDLVIKFSEVLNLNNKSSEAEVLITRLLETDPLNTNTIELYHNLLCSNGNESLYFEWLEQLVQQYPNESALYHQLSSSYRNAGNDDAAEQVLREGLLNNPADDELKLMLADFLSNSSHLQEAIDLYGDYAQNVPNASYAYLQLGNLHLTLGNYNVAYSSYQTSINISPQYRDEINILLEQHKNELTHRGLFYYF